MEQLHIYMFRNINNALRHQDTHHDTSATMSLILKVLKHLVHYGNEPSASKVTAPAKVQVCQHAHTHVSACICIRLHAR